MDDQERRALLESRIHRHQTFIRDALKEGDGDQDCRAQAKADMSLPYLRHAIARIDQGEGHQCEDCGEDIPAKRLEAVPGAIRCIECQKDQEKANGRHAHQTL